MTTKDILHWRLYNQGLTRQVATDAAGIVSRLTAMQAQDYQAAKWAIGLRIGKVRDSEVEQAVAAGAIIRTWSLRGTLHFMAPQDTRWILSLVATRLQVLYASYYRRLGLEGAALRKGLDCITGALAEGTPLTRAALQERLQRKKLPTHEMRVSFLLLRAALQRLVCFGPRSGKDLTYVLLDNWVPRTSDDAEADEKNLATLLRRYFLTRGPATVQDAAWWSGFTIADVTAALQQVKHALQMKRLDGIEYWMPKEDPGVMKPANLYLTPAFDEYLVAYRDRSLMLDPYPSRQVIGANGLFSPCVMIKGKVIGTWKRTFGKDGVLITIRPFEPLSAAIRKKVISRARQYAQFLGSGPASVAGM